MRTRGAGQGPRLVLVAPQFPKLSETFVVHHFLGLLERGWDAHMVCDRSPAAEWRAFPLLAAHPEARRRVHLDAPTEPYWRARARLLPEALGTAVRAPGRGAGLLRRVGRREGWARALRRLYLESRLVRLAPDLVHFEFGSLALGRADLGELLGCRVVVSFRGFDLDFVGLEEDLRLAAEDGVGPGEPFYADVWRGADGYHFLGHYLRQRATERGWPEDRIHALIPPALDADRFSPPAAGERGGGPFTVLAVGRLHWKKGYEHALGAVARLRAAGVDCRFRVVGAGDALDCLAFARHELGLEDVATFVGPLPPEQVRREMARADVLLHLAVSEGFCNAVLEAQAMELPVVVSDAGGLPENVADGDTGFVVPRRDPAAAAERLVELAADPDLRRRLGRSGRRRVMDRFRLDRQIDAFEDLYRRVLGS